MAWTVRRRERRDQFRFVGVPLPIVVIDVDDRRLQAVRLASQSDDDVCGGLSGGAYVFRTLERHVVDHVDDQNAHAAWGLSLDINRVLVSRRHVLVPPSLKRARRRPGAAVEALEDAFYRLRRLAPKPQTASLARRRKSGT